MTRSYRLFLLVANVPLLIFLLLSAYKVSRTHDGLMGVAIAPSFTETLIALGLAFVSGYMLYQAFKGYKKSSKFMFFLAVPLTILIATVSLLTFGFAL